MHGSVLCENFTSNLACPAAWFSHPFKPWEGGVKPGGIEGSHTSSKFMFTLIELDISYDLAHYALLCAHHDSVINAKGPLLPLPNSLNISTFSSFNFYLLFLTLRSQSTQRHWVLMQSILAMTSEIGAHFTSNLGFLAPLILNPGRAISYV